jgi:hypothetical protein
MMNTNKLILTSVMGVGGFATITMGTALAQIQLTNQSKLSLNGIGTVKVGMTLKQASISAGTTLVRGDGYQDSCYYVTPRNKSANVSFMVTSGRIARIDVPQKSPITTLKGAKIGDTEAKIKSLYPGKIKVEPHKYVKGGHYLVFVPQEQTYKNYRLVFETDGKRVTLMRAGKLPEASYVEGCS